jgi:hypothetical protein
MVSMTELDFPHCSAALRLPLTIINQTKVKFITSDSQFITSDSHVNRKDKHMERDMEKRNESGKNKGMTQM